MTPSFWRGVQRPRWLLLLPVAMCLVSVHLFPNQVLTWLDQKCIDLVITLRTRAVPDHPVVIVSKDAVFRERFGRDPDRADMARVLNMLASAGAPVAGLDFLYLDAQSPANDRALRAAFAFLPATVIAERFQAKTGFSGVESFAWRPTSGRPSAPTPLYEPVAAGAHDRGLINVFLGYDEMIRVMPLAFLPVASGDGPAEFRPSLGFAVWVHWLLATAPQPDWPAVVRSAGGDAVPSSPEAVLRAAFVQAPHPFRSLGHAGLDRLVRRREAQWVAQHLLHASASASAAAAALVPGADRVPEVLPTDWTAAVEHLLAHDLPARTWLPLPAEPLPIIGTTEAPCLRLPLTKLAPPLVGDGIQVLSMGALLPTEADAAVGVAAARRSLLEVGHGARRAASAGVPPPSLGAGDSGAGTEALREVPLAFAFEDPGTETIVGQAVDFSGGPLPGVQVLCRRVAGSFWATAETDAHGRYRLDALPAGSYTLELGWTCGSVTQILTLDRPVTAGGAPVGPARFFPGTGRLVASGAAAPYERELIVAGEGLWFAESGPAGELPLATPPAGVSVQFFDSEVRGRWDAGRLLGSDARPLPHTRVALLDDETPWKSSWRARCRVPAGTTAVTVTGLPPALGARVGLLRPAAADGELRTVDIDLAADTVAALPTWPAETESDERIVPVKWIQQGSLIGSEAIELLLVAADGRRENVPNARGTTLIRCGKWQVLARQGARRGVYDALRAMVGGKAVFVGTRMPEDQDFRICPLNFMDSAYPTIPGVNLHAHLFSALARGEFLQPTVFHYDRFPQAWPLMTLLLLLPLLLGLDELFARRGALWGGAAVVVSGGGWLAVSLTLFAANVLFPMFLPIACLGVFGVSRGYLAYAQARQRERETRATFGRFVSAQMVDEILRNPKALRPGGDKKPLTVMFTDLAGFTSISEKLTPEELTALMNEYLGEMTNILFAHGGTLDKYIGDAIMGFWNHPAEQPDHALRAVRCAIAMQARLDVLRARWLARGLPEVSMRAGINTCEAMVGFIGSDVQMNFTCLGDGVNLASRLEGANKAYHTFMMMADSTRSQLPAGVIRSRLLDFLAVKGKEQPIKVYEIIGEGGAADDQWQRILLLYDEGMAHYLARRWSEAEARFREVLALRPDDGPAATYLERCAVFRENPPAEGWDGRFVLKTK